MDIINVLPTDVANKIAAGEVIERPASAIKELVENSIDSGADKITVEIKDGGISYMRVTDNGKGMSYNDAKTAFLRHATSKVKTAEDLHNICTLGFRGEALASIAAVSDVEVITKSRQSDGVFLELKTGKIIKDEYIGCPDGTTIVVKRLFYNVPARMKFLKKNSTEGGYITDILQRLILANPSISFKFIVDGKEKLFHNGDGLLKTCIYSIYGKEYADNILIVDRNQNNVKISGYIGRASLSRSNRSYQSLYVNGRYVVNKQISFRIEQGFENTLMTHKFPFYTLNIELSPNLIDINVHPTKQEVKFADERMVGNEVYWAVKDALACDADIIRNDIIKTQGYFVSQTAQKIEKPTQLRMNFQSQNDVNQKSTAKTEKIGVLSSPKQVPIFEDIITDKPEIDYRVVGQLFNTYIVIELKDKIVLIDQHAAHERLIYEKLLSSDKEKLSQILLSPCVVSFNPKEFCEIIEYSNNFIRLGFNFEDFGSNSLLVRAAPDGVDSSSIRDLMLELLKKFSKGDFDNINKEVLHTIACKAAIKGNSALSHAEIDSLINELIETGGINSCPHGRPIMISYTKYELEKHFKRIQ